MNLEELKYKLKTDVKFQLILSSIIFLLFLIFIFNNVFFKKSQKPAHCFGSNLTIWFPFKKEEFESIIKPIADYHCLKIKVEKKSFEQIDRDFLYSLAEKEPPDIIFIDNLFVSKNKDFLYEVPNNYKIQGFIFSDKNEKFGYPLFVDTLVLFANQDILDFLGKEPPQTIEELNNFIREFNSKNYSGYYTIGLGSTKVKNKKEIVLVMASVFKKYSSTALENFFSYTNSSDELLAFKQEDKDINMFARGKLIFYIGFYEDKKEILKLNPRIKLSIYPSPIDTFPPKGKNFVKVYYAVIPKDSKNKKYAFEFLKTLISKKYGELSEIYDLIPNKELANISSEKIQILDLIKYGSTYEKIILQPEYKNFDRVFDVWENNPNDGKREFSRLKLNLIEK